MHRKYELERDSGLLVRMAPFVIGSTAGMIEVTCNHPMWIIKTLVQTNKYNSASLPPAEVKISIKDLANPRLLYSGVLSNALSMIPATGLRIGVNQSLIHFFSNDIQNPPFFQRLVFMSVAGVSAAFVCGPVDLVNLMKYKLKRQALVCPEQKIGTSFIAAAVYLIKKQNGYQCLTYGLPATMIREGTYTPFFLGMTPYVKSKLLKYSDNDLGATIVSGAITGIIASIVTQPLDTIKTAQQDVQLNQINKPKSWLSTADKIYKEGGWPSFFAGGVWRMARVVSAISVMTYVTDKMYSELNKLKR